MIRSMTGYGQVSFVVEEQSFDVEIRSVNHRYLDIRIRLPRALSAHEAAIKALIQARLQRGKVDVSVAQASAGAPARLELDLEVSEQYLNAARSLAERHGLSGELDLTSILSLPGVVRFVEQKLSVESVGEALDAGVEAALRSVESMRVREGEALEREIDSRLGRVVALVESLEGRTEVVQQTVRGKLRRRAEQLQSETGLLDEARLHQEVVLAADRLDIAEELVRLRSHVEQFRSFLAAAGVEVPAGRRLDFLLQEMGREVNTIGSKGTDAPISHEVVELKAELERIREQVQNIE